MMPVKLFIGGLPPNTTHEEVAKRFKPFATTFESIHVELIPPKTYGGDPPMTFDRPFGFVTLDPKDDVALKRAVQVYNGSQWKGSVLRCQLAKESSLDRLAKERATAAAEGRAPRKETMPMAEEGSVLYIKKPYRRSLIAVKLGARRVTTQRLCELPDTGAGIAEFQRAAVPPLRLHATPGGADGKEKALKYDDGRVKVLAKKKLRPVGKNSGVSLPAGNKLTKKVAPTRRGTLPKSMPAQQRSAPRPPASLAVVDFMSADEHKSAADRKFGVDLSRFADDGEAEAGTGTEGGMHAFGETIPQVDGVYDTSCDEEEQEEKIEKPRACVRTSKKRARREEQDTDADSLNNDTRNSGRDGTSSSESDASTSNGAESEEEDTNKKETHTGGGDGADQGTAPQNSHHHGASLSEGNDAWLKHVLPAGAAFFRSEPLVQVEATWRASREMISRDFKERRRQALRSTGKHRT